MKLRQGRLATDKAFEFLTIDGLMSAIAMSSEDIAFSQGTRMRLNSFLGFSCPKKIMSSDPDQAGQDQCPFPSLPVGKVLMIYTGKDYIVSQASAWPERMVAGSGMCCPQMKNR